jgi:hypothetical protein
MSAFCSSLGNTDKVFLSRERQPLATKFQHKIAARGYIPPPHDETPPLLHQFHLLTPEVSLVMKTNLDFYADVLIIHIMENVP